MKNFNDFLIELNRFEKKTGIDTKTGKPITKGGTAKDDKAYQFVAKKYAGQLMGGKQKKKVKAEKPGGGGKYLKMQDQKKQQRLFGIIRAIKKGVFKGKKTPKIQRIASSISDKDLKKWHQPNIKDYLRR